MFPPYFSFISYTLRFHLQCYVTLGLDIHQAFIRCSRMLLPRSRSEFDEIGRYLPNPPQNLRDHHSTALCGWNVSAASQRGCSHPHSDVSVIRWRYKNPNHYKSHTATVLLWLPSMLKGHVTSSKGQVFAAAWLPASNRYLNVPFSC